MDYGPFVDALRARTGLNDVGKAEGMACATFEALGSLLDAGEATRASEALPPAFAEALRRPGHAGVGSADELYRRVAERASLPPAEAIELAQVALQLLAESLDNDTRTSLQRDLPPSLSALLVPRAHEGYAPSYTHAAVREREDTSLAGGRPGTATPLSEARADRAHPHSVARSENPHADTKLSASPGLSQERRGDTLAEGNPRSGRPVSEGR
jgi:uncharacterized protein (DUF2267 family)